MADQEQRDVPLQNKRRPWVKKLGFLLIALSILLYAGLLLVPFIPYSIGTKAAISSVLVILGEISFWVGGFILGKDIVAKYKKYFNPLRWFKKTKQ